MKMEIHLTTREFEREFNIIELLFEKRLYGVIGYWRNYFAEKVCEQRLVCRGKMEIIAYFLIT